MNNILTILKKELRRIFTDKRMLMSLILPGILIFVLYSLMGSFLTNSFTANTDYTYKVYVFNQPESLKTFNHTDKYKITIFENTDNIENSKSLLSNKSIDLLIVYDENFEQKMLTDEKPNVEVYYNSTSAESTEIYQYYFTSLSSLSINNISYNYFVNAGQGSYDLATKEDTSAQIITMMVPFILMVLLFSACMAVSTESIAGEKERGTISTLLVTPTKRSQIAIGKVLALAIASLVSSLSSFIGLISSLPKLMGGENEMTLAMYNFTTYFSIFILIIGMVILFTVLLSIISTFAKSIKEASQYAVTLIVIVMMFGLTSMMSGGNTNSLWSVYFIPIYNTVQCMSSIFALSFNPLHFVITIISNIAYIGIGIFVLTKMFNSEKIMFNK